MAFRSQLVCPQHFCFAGLPFSYPWLPDFGFLAASTGIALCRMESCGGVAAAAAFTSARGIFLKLTLQQRLLPIFRKRRGRMNKKPLAFLSLSTTEMLQ